MLKTACTCNLMRGSRGFRLVSAVALSGWVEPLIIIAVVSAWFIVCLVVPPYYRDNKNENHRYKLTFPTTKSARVFEDVYNLL